MDTLPKKNKSIFITVSIILFLCFSLFTISHFYYNFLNMDFGLMHVLIILIIFFPISFMTIGLVLLQRKQSKTGYFILMLPAIFYFIRDAIFSFKRLFFEHQIPEDFKHVNIPDILAPERISYLIFIEILLIIILLIFLFNKELQSSLNLTRKNYLISFGLLFLYIVSTTTIQNVRNSEKSIRFKPELEYVLATDYPSEIDSIIDFEIRKQYHSKDFEYIVLSEKQKSINPHDIRNNTTTSNIENSHFIVEVRVEIEMYFIRNEKWRFDYENKKVVEIKKIE